LHVWATLRPSAHARVVNFIKRVNIVNFALAFIAILVSSEAI